MTGRVAVMVAVGVVAFSGPPSARPAAKGAAGAGAVTAIFADDFERGLSRGQLVCPPGVSIRDSGDPGLGAVMELTPDGDVVALVRGSDVWDRVRLEGDMRFPYESYVDLQAGAWTRMRVEVAGRAARLYVHGAPQPALVVTDLKLGTEGGGVALWIGPGTEGFFANLRVAPKP